jgi:soluble lytic murein transglycosylase
VIHLVHVFLWLASIAAPEPAPRHIGFVADSGEVATTLDTTLARAAEALARGRPWQATRLLSPFLRDSSQRSPAAVFLAATAASEWGGWPEVLRLLQSEPWIDTLYDGRGRILLARALLDRGSDSLALEQATAALRIDSTSGERLLLLAAALDRLTARDSAAAVYLRAAQRVPQAAEWIKLRAAAVTDDSAGRARIYASIFGPLPRSRIPWSEAEAHEHTGDLAGAARRYAALGDRLSSLRLRLAASPDSAPRALIRRELLALATERSGSSAAREAVALLDSLYSPLETPEELVASRAALRSGLLYRAVSGFSSLPNLGPEDRFDYATALARLGRNRDAAIQFNHIRAPHQLAALAAYQSARSLVRDGQLAKGKSALVRVSHTYPRDTTAAASAFFLRADLASDDRDEAEARRLYQVVAARYPTSRFAPTSRFRAAMIALLSADTKTAAEEFDLLADRYSASSEAIGATYWAGRSWAQAGDSALAFARWHTVSARDPLSYYAALSAARLGTAAWGPAVGRDTFPADPEVDGVVTRAAVLRHLGLLAESRSELDQLARSADSSPDRLLILANAFRSQGMASQAIQLARRALARGASPDGRTFRLIYPLIHEDALLAEAAEQQLDPSLVAAVIRQESSFNPAATSPAGARGLAQVMPELGERLARELNYPIWDPVLLYQPDVSIQLGAVHLRELLGTYDKRARILAAYNAGRSRVERWSKRVGVDDPEVFAERISFVETRDYVRIIQRNEEIYRSLYGSDLLQRADAVPPASSAVDQGTASPEM